MKLPFTAKQFFDVFRLYNEMVWPAQVALNLLAIVAIGLWIWRSQNSSRLISGILALLWAGVIKGQLAFTSTIAIHRILGSVLVVFALLVYPALSGFFGHGYPAMPTFGLPCPTTIFTVGMLCFLASPYPKYVLAAPVLWSAVGSQGAFLLGVYQDIGLLAAGIIAVFLIGGVEGSRPQASEER